jgi:hypothetical protein
MVLLSAWTVNDQSEAASHFVHTESVSIHIYVRINKWVPSSELRLIVGDLRGRRVFTSDTDLEPPSGGGDGSIRAIARIPPEFLRPETYIVTLALFVSNQVVLDVVDDAFSFVVQDGGSKYAASEGLDYGCVFACCEWAVANAPADEWRQPPAEVIAALPSANISKSLDDRE